MPATVFKLLDKGVAKNNGQFAERFFPSGPFRFVADLRGTEFNGGKLPRLTGIRAAECDAGFVDSHPLSDQLYHAVRGYLLLRLPRCGGNRAPLAATRFTAMRWHAGTVF
jgi:hypothetical protein